MSIAMRMKRNRDALLNKNNQDNNNNNSNNDNLNNFNATGQVSNPF